MGIERTSEEMQQEMIDKMGPELGLLFHSLHTELLWLTYRWIEFRELYGTKESRIELLNSSAPFLFYTIQNVLWENLLLGVAKITDPPTSIVKKVRKKNIKVRKKNITFKAISAHLENEEFKKEIEDNVKELESHSQFCRDWRNRRIAHMDYELHVNKANAEPLEVATRLKFKTTIEQMFKIYNKVSMKYLGSQSAFEYLSSDNGAISLLNILEKGLHFEREILEKKLSGNWMHASFQSKI